MKGFLILFRHKEFLVIPNVTTTVCPSPKPHKWLIGTAAHNTNQHTHCVSKCQWLHIYHSAPVWTTFSGTFTCSFTSPFSDAHITTPRLLKEFRIHFEGGHVLTSASSLFWGKESSYHKWERYLWFLPVTQTVTNSRERRLGHSKVIKFVFFKFLFLRGHVKIRTHQKGGWTHRRGKVWYYYKLLVSE